MSTRTARPHPLFARFYRRMADAGEHGEPAVRRDQLLAGLTGRVVEIGAGSGTNFAHYPDTVTGVVAVEPEPYLRTWAEAAAERAPVPVSVVDGTADALPLTPASVDAGVVSLVLCSVPDQAAALAELFRVIRPGGELRFLEHVASDDPRWARRQRRLDPIWSAVSGGCHITRHTGESIEAAGFVVETRDEFQFPSGVFGRLGGQHILGRASRP
ncbi:MAG TPA: methyltransferase domain-containing protein [Pseudonocardiaceae bacterium]